MTKQVEVPANLANDLIWGAQAIADYLGCPRWQVYYLARNGNIPVQKLGKKTMVARRSELDRATSALKE